MKEQEYTESEEKIFLAALEVFSREGKNGARMQEIADRAGMNKALIHYYFRSKDRLYSEVFSFVARRYFLRMAAAMRTDASFSVLLHEFIDRYIDLLNENPALPMFILREITEGAPVMAEKLRDIVLPAGDGVPAVFLARFNAAVEAGDIRDLDASQTLITVMGACIYFFVGYPLLAMILPELHSRRDEYLEERKQHIYDLVMNGLKPRTEPQS
ncbi:MAG: TetR family transcriptional regulator [Bacteroidota bacterium]|nr:TetR family transcriptional regulator [Bacteroidota bacterium]